MFHSPSLIRATSGYAALLTFLSVPSAFANTLLPGTLAQDAPQSPALRIVVLVGENAVNVIKKSTVVMPVVQVLDQSGKPVVGAEVTFFAPADGASVQLTDGSRSATITTDVDGKASLVGGVAIGAGDFEYKVTALFHDQRATVSIKQTNVTSQGQSGGASAHSSRLVWWVIGGVAAAAAVGIGAGLGHGGTAPASSPPSAVIGAGSGLTVGAPH